jgi:hypothetical protein
MPAPRFTPAQRQFGIGLTPTYDIFRPPEGMELDPAYSPATRQQQGLAMTADLQRQAFKDAADEQAFARQQRMDDQQMQQVEQQATEALRGAPPEEFGNILSKFPELARSKNLGGFTNFAQAVTPSAGQKTLAPSLRNRLKPHERQYFDEHFTKGGDAVSAFDSAQLRGEHENGLVDMMKSGVPLDVIDKYRDRPLSPIEREAIVQQHATTKGGKSTSPLQDAYELDLKALYDDDEFLSLPPADKAKRVRDMRLAYELDKAAVAQQVAQAQGAPVAGQVQQNAVAGAPKSQLKEVLGGKPEATQKAFALPNEIEMKAMINSPEAVEGDYSGLIENANVPIHLKKQALEKFRAFAANPPTLPGSTLGDVLARKDKIAEQLKRAEKAVRLAPEQDKYIQAWSDAKQDTAKDISRFAKSIGADEDSIVNSLAKDEIIEIPGRFNPETEDFKWSVRDLFYDDQAKRLGVDARRIPSLPNERLEPFQKSEFAKELGVESFTLPGLRRIELGSGKKTYDDVLNAYVQEKVKPVARANQSANVAPNAVKTSTGNTATLKSAN